MNREGPKCWKRWKLCSFAKCIKKHYKTKHFWRGRKSRKSRFGPNAKIPYKTNVNRWIERGQKPKKRWKLCSFENVSKSITKQSISGEGENPENHVLGQTPKYLIKPMWIGESRGTENLKLEQRSRHRKSAKRHYKTKQLSPGGIARMILNRLFDTPIQCRFPLRSDSMPVGLIQIFWENQSPTPCRFETIVVATCTRIDFQIP